jgi:hypothetical protein
MFARFHQTPSRLQVSLRESRRVGGKPRCEHIASLGSVPEPMTIAGRVEFYRRASERLAKLSNRIGADDKKKIVAALRARIPPVTDDEIRTVQRENAEADEKFWSGLQDMNSETAEGNRALAADASRKAAEAEAHAKYAAEKVATAKDRLDRLTKGEDVKGGLGKPMTWKDFERILKDAGLSDDDIRFMREFRLTEAEFDAFVEQSCELHRRHEKSDRWKVLREIKSRPAVA